MKILHFISGGDTGGAKTHVFTLLDNLRREGIDAELLCIMESSFTEEARAMGIRVTVIPQKKRYDLSVNRRILAFIKSSGCDVLHCHGARANFITMFLMKKLPVPAVTTIHSNYKLDFRGNRRKQLIYTPMNSMALRRFQHMLCVTGDLKQVMVDNGFDPDRIRVIYNGVDFENEPETLPEEQFFETVGVTKQPGKKYVGIAARLHAIKGFDVFL
ncbi:MAG: glycosyltransferase family 4 protein, partial [Anaerovoracaceae bacterium]